MLRSRILGAVFAIGLLAIGVNAQEQPSGNLRSPPGTTVSSESEGTKAENLTDGDITNSEWTAKEGTTPANTWVRLTGRARCRFRKSSSARTEIQSSPTLTCRSGIRVANGGC